MNSTNPESTERRALIIGASGAFGHTVGRELAARGWHITCLRRPEGKPIDIQGAEEIRGDALNPEDVERAARHASVIVYAYNAPYTQWSEKVLPAGRAVAQAAARSGARIVLPGNVYGLGPDFSEPLGENCRHEALTNKGRIRNELESILEAATQKGAKLLTVRCGDFFGPGATSTSWLHQLTKGALNGGALVDPAPAGVPHEWAYLPDVARLTADLLDREQQLAVCETFHVSTHRLTSEQLMTALNTQFDQPRRIKRFPWTAVPLLSWLVPLLREVREMKYLWDQPVLLDDSKLRRFLGGFEPTPLPVALRRSLGFGGQGDLKTDRRSPKPLGTANSTGRHPSGLECGHH